MRAPSTAVARPGKPRVVPRHESRAQRPRYWRGEIRLPPPDFATLPRPARRGSTSVAATGSSPVRSPVAWPEDGTPSRQQPPRFAPSARLSGRPPVRRGHLSPAKMGYLREPSERECCAAGVRKPSITSAEGRGPPLQRIESPSPLKPLAVLSSDPEHRI